MDEFPDEIPIRKDQRQRIGDWFPSKGIELKCPLCGGEDFLVGGMYVVPQFDATGFVSEHGAPRTDENAPMLPLACKNCGYMMIFHPKIMGLLD